MAKRSEILTALGGEVPTNGAADLIEDSEKPYVATVKIKGDVDILFHAWNCEAVETKAKAAKGSVAKKTDDTESYMYRDDDGFICLPGEIEDLESAARQAHWVKKYAWDAVEAAMKATLEVQRLAKAKPVSGAR